MQTQSFGGVLLKAVLKKFAKLTGKNLYQILFLMKFFLINFWEQFYL